MRTVFVVLTAAASAPQQKALPIGLRLRMVSYCAERGASKKATAMAAVQRRDIKWAGEEKKKSLPPLLLVEYMVRWNCIADACEAVLCGGVAVVRRGMGQWEAVTMFIVELRFEVKCEGEMQFLFVLFCFRTFTQEITFKRAKESSKGW